MSEHEHDADATTVTSARDDAPLAIPIGQMSVLEDLVHQLDDAIRSARNVPLSSSAMIDRKEILGIIETLQRSIPEEIARARAVIRDRDEILERAHEQGQRIVDRAQQDRERLVSKTEIVQAASREADAMIGEAETVARRIRGEAEEYVESKLATFEVVLQKTLDSVKRGRARLAGRIEADELVDDGSEHG